MSAKLASIPGLVAVTVALAACGGATADEQASSSGDGSLARQDAAAAASRPDGRRAAQSSWSTAGARVKSRSSGYGTILVDGRGRTLYLFDKEGRAKSECYGACATAWPPLLAKGNPVAKGAPRQGLLGTTRRQSGRAQVTYGGHPLYTYAAEDPGQILCQNVLEFGGYWLIVRPSGEPVR
jgi:predicted lipoprotein with Yx(FWY)xxD motif